MEAEVFIRLGVDVVALAVLVYAIYLRRHRRMDLAVVYAMFNLGLFVAVVVITRGHVTLGVSLGLFAVLSMVRLRSEAFATASSATSSSRSCWPSTPAARCSPWRWRPRSWRRCGRSTILG